MEEQVDGVLNFLDLKIHHSDNHFILDVFRKPTFSGRLLMFSSYVPKWYKVSLIQCMLFRLSMIISNFSADHYQINLLKSIFIFNDYPANFVDRIVQFWFHKFDKKNSKNCSPSENPTKKQFLILPFVDNAYVKINRWLHDFKSKHNLKANIRLVFSSNNRLCNLFKFKDKIPKKFISKVVYNAKCSGCAACYIGQTTRYLNERIIEHEKGKPKSNIFEHLQNSCTNATMNFDILAKYDNSIDLVIAEGILIKLRQPLINIQRDSKLFCL